MPFKDDCQKLLDRYLACYRAGDAEGCAAVFTEDAQMFSPFGPPALGRAAIASQHVDWVREGAEDKQVTVLDAGANGDLGWCLASFSEGATGAGVSLNVLRRQSDGAWRIARSSLNATDAP